MFEDRLVVESPGTLPGLVRLNTMRKVHFSRNPKLAAFLKDYGFVKEFGEGVDRMCKELKESGLPDPEYQVESFMLRCTVKAADVGKVGQLTEQTTLRPREPSGAQSGAQSRAQSGAQSDKVIKALYEKPLAIAELLDLYGLEIKTGAFKRTVKELLVNGLIEYTLPEKPNSRLQKYRLTSKGQARLASMSAR